MPEFLAAGPSVVSIAIRSVVDPSGEEALVVIARTVHGTGSRTRTRAGTVYAPLAAKVADRIGWFAAGQRQAAAESAALVSGAGR
jgi:hypothetical protein